MAINERVEKSRHERIEFSGVTAEINIYDTLAIAVISLEQNGRIVILTSSELLRIARLMPNPVEPLSGE